MGLGKLQSWREGTARGAGAAMAMIVHDASRWGLEEHRALREYLAAHEALGEQPEAIGLPELEALAFGLSVPQGELDEKRYALVVLAHHKSHRAAELLRGYLEAPDLELERFAKLALEEAAQWIAPEHGIRRNEPCPCGSGRKFKVCCGGGLS